jgi:hypothetical protein
MTTSLLSPSLLPSQEAPSPVITTLLHPRNQRARAYQGAWEPPPGWEKSTSIEKITALEGKALYPALRPGTILRELDGHLVIHDPVTRDIHKLNLPAATILLFANGTRTLGNIAEEYARRFDRCLWKAVDDVERVIQELVEKTVVVLRREKNCA